MNEFTQELNRKKKGNSSTSVKMIPNVIIGDISIQI